MKRIFIVLITLSLILLVGCSSRYPTPDMDIQKLFCGCKGMTYESNDYKYGVMFCTKYDGSKIPFDLKELDKFSCNKCCNEPKPKLHKNQKSDFC